MENNICPICFNEFRQIDSDPDDNRIDCFKCGTYIIDKKLSDILGQDNWKYEYSTSTPQKTEKAKAQEVENEKSIKNFFREKFGLAEEGWGSEKLLPKLKKGSQLRANLSAFIRENQRDEGNPPKISHDFFYPKTQDQLGQIFQALPQLSIPERADKLLQALMKEGFQAMEGVKLLSGDSDDNIPLQWQAKAWVSDKWELKNLVQYLQDCHRLTYVSPVKAPDTTYKISSKGWQYVEELNKKRPLRDQGFVAMWFNKELDEFYEKVIKPAIKAAGYTSIRIDEQFGKERITNRIEWEIKQSRFVIADLTGHRGGVYFEAGFARSLNLPVFFICHEACCEKIHFDVSQFAYTKWAYDPDKLDNLKNSLCDSIKNVCGEGKANKQTNDDKKQPKEFKGMCSACKNESCQKTGT